MVHRPQFNGKQEGAFNRPPNLRCPRNGKRTNHLPDSAFIKTTGCMDVRLGRWWKLLRQPGYRPTRWWYVPVRGSVRP